MLSPYIVAATALFGLLIGSFLNVVISRLPDGESVMAPRSRCPGCSAQIRWYDNVPLISFVLLRARCRACHERITWRYPAVELATAVWFTLCALPVLAALSRNEYLTQLALQQTSFLVLGSLLISLAVIDWQHHLLPDALTFSGIFAGLLFACTEAIFLNGDEDNIVLKHAPNINSANAGRSPGNIFLTGPEHLIFGHALAALAAFLLLYVVRVSYRALRKRDGMGLGDAKLLAMIATFVGFAPTFVALFAGVLIATSFAVLLLLRGRANAATRLPFGSFLAAGGLIAAVAGDRIVTTYMQLFR